MLESCNEWLDLLTNRSAKLAIYDIRALKKPDFGFSFLENDTIFWKFEKKWLFLQQK